MHFHFRFPILLLPLSTVAQLSPITSTPPQPPPPLPTLIISHLALFLSNHSTLPSHLSLRVLDPSPDHYLLATCTFVAEPSNRNDWNNGIPSDGYYPCDGDEDEGMGMGLSWWAGENFFALQRGWEDVATGNISGWINGITDKQETAWTEDAGDDEVFCDCAGNVTVTSVGTWYSRTRDWVFPIHTILSE